MEKYKHIFGPMRLPFLILTPVCVLLGVGSAYWTTGHINPIDLLLLLTGGVMAHISVNTFNEYEDFKSGLDFRTSKSPFNGGSGTLVEQPERAIFVLFLAWISFSITAIIGFYFISTKGFLLLPLGIIGLGLIFSYTKWITKYPIFCLMAPGTGFGFIMVLGTYFALTASLAISPFVIAFVPFFLVNNLLLLNQFPDIDADKTVGRRHFPIVYGKKSSIIIYGLFLILAYLVVIMGYYLKLLPALSLLGLMTAIFMIPVYFRLYKHHDEPKYISRYLGINVLNTLVMPILISIGFFIQ